MRAMHEKDVQEQYDPTSLIVDKHFNVSLWHQLYKQCYAFL
jgi:hypothetical protein